MQLDLTILVGTMTGTAQLVAQELELTLDDEHTQVKVRPMDGLDGAYHTCKDKLAGPTSPNAGCLDSYQVFLRMSVSWTPSF